jgi:aminopeptidase
LTKQFAQQLADYAELILSVGLNLQKGQKLVIDAPIESASLIRVVTEKAYRMGASQVYYEWWDDELTLIRYKHAAQESLGHYPLWKAKGYEELALENAAFLFVQAPNPELLKDVDAARIAAETKGRAQVRRIFLDYTRVHKVSWVIAAYPTPGWAKKVFPDLSDKEGQEKLWQVIFQATRVNAPNPVLEWQRHLDRLSEKVNELNRKKFKKLVYKAPGTDLTVELPEGHIWLGGGTLNEQGTRFVANLPTEEVFTMPSREGVNGFVRSTKPLNYGGNLIEEFTLTFERGRIIDFSAKKGYDKLKTILDTDEGARYLGEVSLVPFHSPISEMDIVFYNTLFDENASCHLAIGNAYPTNLIDGPNMSPEELRRRGANTSLIHVDFMMGSPELDIDGELADGTIVPIFRNGDWA